MLPSTTLAGFDGFPGSFTARLRGPAGVEERAFGAVIVATGLELADPARRPFVPGKIVPLPSLSAHLAGLRLRELPKSLAIVLDLEIDEGRASCDAAYRVALEALRDVPGRGHACSCATRRSRAFPSTRRTTTPARRA